MLTGAFQGVVEFELRISLFGKSVKRRARIIYVLTPLWPYFDPQKGAEVKGHADFDFGINILALPRAEADLDSPPKTSKPTWVKADDLLQFGVLNRPIMNIIYERIEADARRQDAANRANWNGEDPPQSHLL